MQNIKHETNHVPAVSHFKAGLPYVELYTNVEFYRKHHTLPRHYSMQWVRHDVVA